MSSPRSQFRVAVKKRPSRERRESAIDELAQMGAVEQLAVLVKSDGLDGTYRRQALDGLDRTNATETLAELADDSSLHGSIRDRAAAIAA